MTIFQLSIASIGVLFLSGCLQQTPPEKRQRTEILKAEDQDTPEGSKDASEKKSKNGADSNKNGNTSNSTKENTEEDDDNNASETTPVNNIEAPTLSWQKVGDQNLLGYRVLVSETGDTVSSQLIKEIKLDDVGFDPEKPSYIFDNLGDIIVKQYTKPCFKVTAFTAEGSSPASEQICM